MYFSRFTIIPKFKIHIIYYFIFYNFKSQSLQISVYYQNILKELLNQYPITSKSCIDSLEAMQNLFNQLMQKDMQYSIQVMETVRFNQSCNKALEVTYNGSDDENFKQIIDIFQIQSVQVLNLQFDQEDTKYQVDTSFINNVIYNELLFMIKSLAKELPIEEKKTLQKEIEVKGQNDKKPSNQNTEELLSQKQKELDETKKKMIILNKNFEANNSKFKVMEDQIRMKDIEIKTRDDEIRRLKSTATSIKTTSSQKMEENLTNLLQQVSQKDGEIKLLREQLSALENPQTQEQNQILQQKDVEIAKLQQQSSENAQIITQMRNDLQQEQEKVKILQELNENYDITIKSYDVQVTKLEEQLKDKCAQVLQLQLGFNNISEEDGQTQKGKDNKIQQINKNSKGNQELQSQDLEQFEAELRIRIDIKQARLHELEDEVANLEGSGFMDKKQRFKIDLDFIQKMELIGLDPCLEAKDQIMQDYLQKVEELNTLVNTYCGKISEVLKINENYVNYVRQLEQQKAQIDTKYRERVQELTQKYLYLQRNAKYETQDSAKIMGFQAFLEQNINKPVVLEKNINKPVILEEKTSPSKNKQRSNSRGQSPGFRRVQYYVK